MTVTLTEKETTALLAIAANGLDNMGGAKPSDLHADNFSWFRRSDISKATGGSKEQTAGLMSSLEAKGLICEEDRGDWALTNSGIDAAQACWEANRTAEKVS